MSNNLVFQIPDRQVSQMEHVCSSLDLPVSDMQIEMVGHVLSGPVSHQFILSNDQMGLVKPTLCDSGFQTSMMSNNRVGQNETSASSMGSSSIWMSNQLGREDTVMQSNLAGEKSLLPIKRKAEVGTLLSNSISRHSPLPSKRPAHMEADVNSLGLLQPSALQKKIAPTPSKLSSPGLQTQPTLNKKMAQNDSITGKFGSQWAQATKKQTAQIEPASEGVRSKMRESLAAALSLAFQKQDNVSDTEKDQSDATINCQVPVDSQTTASNSTVIGHVSSSDKLFPSKELVVVDKTNHCCKALSTELPPDQGSGQTVQTFQEFQYRSILPKEDVSFSDSFFVKDDLLQGNGLSWAFDFDRQMREVKEAQDAGKPKSVTNNTREHGNPRDIAILTSELLAFKIEAELCKLFGGVNKKYKEKGRSLLFNLKDRNNPELIEKVMSGEISPGRLCSMSAEELASKELSQWRMAKAEELAQMVVLPDVEVDVRRLVRKTHKGEYQVEVERDDGITSEVSGGTSMLTQVQPRQKETETYSSSEASANDKENAAGLKSNSENQDFSGSLIIPTDGTDLMHGMMVDELKDAEFLPPIVSLDEFMESLNSEPPFETLSVDAGHKTPISCKESPQAVNTSLASDRVSDSPKTAPLYKADVSQKHEVDVIKMPNGSPVKQKILPSIALKVEYIWGGILQLNTSSSVTVAGLYQSGEKTSAKEWPKSLEIKGRVRLDAFEKFLQELHMSRTRAVMVLHFILRDNLSENERSTLSEAVDSYSADERLGYAEPAPGVELYLCPATSRMVDMLSMHLPSFKTVNSMDIGIIGVVVWRRAHISNTISPNSSSHHKNILKKQPFAPLNRKQDSNVNINTLTRDPMFNNMSHLNLDLEPQSEGDDDIPPGFGPVVGAARPRAANDDDDLPEFNLSGDLNHPSLPKQSSHNLHHSAKMTQVRQLIQKYGQSGSSATSRGSVDNRGLDTEPWKDDDDDFPEWRPEAPHQLHHHHSTTHGHQLPIQPGPVSQSLAANVVTQLLPGGRWVVPPQGPLHGAGWRQL